MQGGGVVFQLLSSGWDPLQQKRWVEFPHSRSWSIYKHNGAVQNDFSDAGVIHRPLNRRGPLVIADCH
jgi:hypothetical protein